MLYTNEIAEFKICEPIVSLCDWLGKLSRVMFNENLKGWLAIAKLIPLSLFISLLLMPNEAFDNVEIVK